MDEEFPQEAFLTDDHWGFLMNRPKSPEICSMITQSGDVSKTRNSSVRLDKNSVSSLEDKNVKRKSEDYCQPKKIVILEDIESDDDFWFQSTSKANLSRKTHYTQKSKSSSFGKLNLIRKKTVQTALDGYLRNKI
jgi:hypothetical protein